MREKMIEHIFLGELSRCLWQRGLFAEVLRPESDFAGYDLVLECRSILRHIQLKASYRDAATDEVSVQTKLASKPSGCVIWLTFDPVTIALGPFLWFGGAPGMPLPPLGGRIPRHSRANSQGIKAERTGHRRIKKASFRALPSISAVADALFFPANDVGTSICPEDSSSGDYRDRLACSGHSS